MSRFAACCLALGLAALAAADDENPKTKTPDKTPDKAPDWSAYLPESTKAGEVDRLVADGFLFKVSKTVPNPNAGKKGQPAVKTVTEKLTVHFAEETLVRWKALHTRLDDKGKKVAYKPDELKVFKKPAGVPGFAAERADLKKGTRVEVTFVRPKTIPAKDVVFQDLKVKTVVILPGEAPPPEPKKKV